MVENFTWIHVYTIQCMSIADSPNALIFIKHLLLKCLIYFTHSFLFTSFSFLPSPHAYMYYSFCTFPQCPYVFSYIWRADWVKNTQQVIYNAWWLYRDSIMKKINWGVISWQNTWNNDEAIYIYNFMRLYLTTFDFIKMQNCNTNKYI